ncbi:MAG: 16S rRNA (cytidine(1402)-2'-O)-methyltransferase, partial [Rhodothermales bacterium]|nr:16S rRNA (cytidine(1402)-2'-O)-methyltransferase [Rhodothermales bacterium]
MLFLVPTPIGNLEDITLRALRVLREVDIIACEDTRTTRILLNKYEIGTKVTSYHEHNERTKARSLVEQMLGGKRIALVSDAGSPGISDPGFYLVRECLRNNIDVDALPGASAIIPSLTASGLPSERFVFEGFLPAKKGRQTRIGELRDEKRTIVFYESPHRIVRTLRDLSLVFGRERPAVVA